ncbi:hypothetical protein [Corynebacterium sp. A21]|uniref:hypothetical protein n=1 Tax=Corynebacterium sp. A21 TaxID=3457318 RepID=UPI003FD49634
MDIAIYQDALVNFEGLGQSINTGLQTAAEFWAQGFNLFGGNTATVETETPVTGTSQIQADIEAAIAAFGSSAAEAPAAPEAPSIENELEIGLETGVEANL